MEKELARTRKMVEESLTGKGAHVAPDTVFEGLSWNEAGSQPKGGGHTVYQLLEHIRYWQDWVLQWLDGKNPRVPAHASGGWPETVGTASAQEWTRAVQNFRNGLHQLEHRVRSAGLIGKNGGKSPLEMLQTIATHNSYHIGEVVAVRQLMGSWPPPKGGLTW